VHGSLPQVINQPVYGGVNAAVRTILTKLDIEVTWLEKSSVENFRKAVKGNTKVR
jgi:O-acetylhomoserine/O-acetylserine sulfhydrylase-like pyridoxal-dependent enzyme